MKRVLTKQGQISLFILLCVVFLLAIFVVYYIQVIAAEKDSSITTITGDQLNLLGPKAYIEQCVTNQVKSSLENAQQLLQNREATIHQKNTYAYLYTAKSGADPLTFSQIEAYLDDTLPVKLTNCFDQQTLDNQGITISRGEIQTKSTLGIEKISIKLDFPLELSLGETVYDATNAIVTVDLPYGKLILAINEMLNAETTNGWFDQQVLVHNAFYTQYKEPILRIQKYKPYPHTIYDFTLKQFNDSYTLNVGIKGENTALLRSSGISFSPRLGEEQTCCEFSEMCVEGTTQSTCSLRGGFFKESCNCQEEKTPQETNSFVEFNSCSGIESGTSWCEYHPGVGGRFYRNLCVNGEVQIESCRDFREEVCVEENDQAYCRPNTAQSCFSCTDESCCSKYDCSYVAKGICVPESSLGFQFWDATEHYCQEAYTKIADSSDISDFTARERNFLCSLLSDCGNTFNYYGDFSQETIDGDKLKNVLTDTGVLTYESNAYPDLIQDLPNKTTSPSKRFAQTITHFDEFLDVSKDSYLNPANPVTFSQTISQLCQPFYPTQNTCEICGENRPCSEYACKSLGTQCQYLLINGTHACVSDTPVAENFLITSMKSEASQIKTTQLHAINGYTFSESQSSLTPLNVSFKTSKPALCKPSFVPGISFGELGTSDVSNGVYTTNHTFIIRFINDLPIFAEITSYFGLQSPEDLLSEIVDFSFQVEKLQRKYPFIDRYQLPFATALTQFVKVSTELELDGVVETLLAKAAQKSFVVFFTCVDESGAALNEQSFIEFNLQNACSEPLSITVASDAGAHVHTKVSLQAQTFSECRYDTVSKAFDDLQYEYNCPDEVFDITTSGYECSADVSVLLENKTELTLYSQCREIHKPAKNFVLFEIPTNRVDVVNESNLTKTNKTVQTQFSYHYIRDGSRLNYTREDNTTDNVVLSFSSPTICQPTQLRNITCVGRTCVIPTTQPNATDAQISLSCVTLPESYLCPNTFEAPKLSQINTSTFSTLKSFEITEISALPNSLSFVATSSAKREYQCAYQIENGRKIPITGKSIADNALQFTEQFAEVTSGLVKISCIDQFGIRIEKSTFITE